MLLFFAIIYLLQGYINADAAPLSVIFPRQTTIGSSLPQECVCPNTRSTWDIVWSCLATIFACSWVSVHPNIPPPGERWWKKALRRLELMVWSIIGPEFIIFWASLQWKAARHLASKYTKDGWTMTHGYFIQMGGFMLYDGDDAVGVLGPEKLEDLLREEKIAMPTITEGEIKDRSKGDGLSKALVITQTTWFIAQCIARRVCGLVIAELELVTVALAALNVVMYAFWWNKPLDVQTTVPVYLLHPSPPKPSPQGEEDEAISHGDGSTFRGNTTGDFSLQGSDIELENLVPSSEIRPHQPINRLNLRDLTRQVWRVISGILFRWPVAAVFALFVRIGEITGSDTIVAGRMYVDTFYIYPAGSEWDVGDVGFPLIGILFGAIHCAGWNFLFPSLIEAYIWRVSSVVIAVFPAAWLVVMVLVEAEGKFLKVDSLISLFLIWMGLLIAVMFPFYVLARLALLVEALISLRDLSPGALAGVEWTSFIPHV